MKSHSFPQRRRTEKGNMARGLLTMIEGFSIVLPGLSPVNVPSDMQSCANSGFSAIKGGLNERR